MSILENFPKKYDPKTVEPKWQKIWAEEGHYRFDEKRDPSETFSVDTPPPTVSGKLHIGHVYSYTHTEIISRFWRMKGRNVLYPFGYDDNGLPTELLTERDHKVKAHQMDRNEFGDLCRETGKKYAQAFQDLWTRLGFSCDFENAYSTISETSQKISQWSFIDLYKKGKVERRKDPALWCTKCVTSFAQAEIEDTFKAGKFIHIPFEVEGEEPLEIATTRPELLPACGAVFYHPDDQRFQKYKGKIATVPLFGQKVKILPDDKAQMDKGTGVVMCCTFGDSTDVQWWREHHLELREAISKFGKMTELCGPLAHLKIEEARSKVIELLQEKHLVLKTIEIPAEKRVVNTHERCGTPVEFIVQEQWFVKVCEIKKELLDYGRKIKWHPEHMRHRYENWVENLAWDWAISRQRHFGVPIPAWYSEDEKHIHVADLNDLPIDPLKTQPKVPCPDGGKWRGDKDVFDTWATSSTTPDINARTSLKNERKKFLPMSMRPQAHDIIRTWAFYTIVKSYYHRSNIPWTHIVISGHVKKPGAEVVGQQMEGQQFVKKTKISKSKDGEKFSPEKILDQHSADAIRLWCSGSSLGIDIMFEEETIKENWKFLNKLWNATKFGLMQLENFDPKEKFKGPWNAEDLWIKARFKELNTVYQKTLGEEFEIHTSKVRLDKFFWISLCDNYIEFVKCRLEGASEVEKQSSLHTLYEILLWTLKLYAPYVPHITEEIYSLYFSKYEDAKSIHLSRIPEVEKLTREEKEILESEEHLLATISAIRQYKTLHQLPFKVEANQLTIGTTREGEEYLEPFKRVLQNFASAKKLCFVKPAETEEKGFQTDQADTKIILEIDEKSLKALQERKKQGSSSP